MSANDLYGAVRIKFPAMAERADLVFKELFGDSEPHDNPYTWFESLASVLNADMRLETPFRVHESLLLFMDGAASRNCKEVSDCIDAAFVENLFYGVPPHKRVPYWAGMPPRLKEFYVAFHRHEP